MGKLFDWIESLQTSNLKIIQKFWRTGKKYFAHDTRKRLEVISDGEAISV